MIDVKFNEAMEPLVQAMLGAHEKHYDLGPDLSERHAAAAVVEALGIPAQMVEDDDFRADLMALVDAHKKPQDGTPSVIVKSRDGIAKARKALERVFWWLAAGDEGPEADLPDVGYEVGSHEGKKLAELQEQVRVAARSLGGLREKDEADTLPSIREDEPEAITEPGGLDFIPDPPACGAPSDNAT